MKPDFIVIGPGRTGTTYLYQVLLEHPDVCTPLHTKEINYFNHEYQRGLAWYQSFFDHCPKGMVSGEISNTYIYDENVPERIKDVLPDVKLITILRNPFQRILSAYHFRKSVGEINGDLSFSGALESHPDLVTDNFYGSHLAPYFSLFPRENILVGFYDQLEESPDMFLGMIYRFLGVNEGFLPKTAYQRINAAKHLRFPVLAPLIRTYADTLRKIQLFSILEKSKESPLIGKFLYSDSISRDQSELIDLDSMAYLKSVFIPELKKLESLLERDLSPWYKSV